MTDRSERITEVLAPYGIATTLQFWRQYHSDALVHALVTIILAQDEATKVAVKEALMKGVEEGAKRALDRVGQLMGEEKP